MRNVWDADIEVTPELVRNLITTQFPEFNTPIDPLSSGWDNEAYLAGNVVFRFPRRNIAIKLIEREIRILPLLAPHLPAPIPVSAYIGMPTDAYPATWAGYPILPGTTACRTTPIDNVATPLGNFLKQLHSIPVEPSTREWAPGDDIERTNLQARLPKLLERLQEAGETTLITRAEALAGTPPWQTDTVWVHGDLYPSHLLIEDGRLSGIIDWGDVHLGDPALDLSIAFTYLSETARPTFFQAYGPIDQASLDRALFRAIHYGATLLLYGQAEGIERFVAMGRRALQSVASL